MAEALRDRLKMFFELVHTLPTDAKGLRALTADLFTWRLGRERPQSGCWSVCSFQRPVAR